MNINQLVPASQLANNLGVKCIAYGDPGTGKSPLITTAPRAVMCACEPGLLSMRSSNVPTWEAYTRSRAQEFFDWIFYSAEAKAFDTVAIDSISQYSEIVLSEELPKSKDLRRAYGEMAREVYSNLAGLYFLQYKHVYLTAKKQQAEEGVANRLRARPYFPGKELHVKVPHLYDEILHLEKVFNPPDGKYYPAFRTVANDAVLARDRSGKLAELENPNLTALFTKAMSA